jgi:hypothetical protein
MCVQPFYGKGPHKLLWADSRTASGKTTVTGISNCESVCEIVQVYTRFTNVSASRIIQPGGQRVGDPNSGLNFNSKLLELK